MGTLNRTFAMPGSTWTPRLNRFVWQNPIGGSAPTQVEQAKDRFSAGLADTIELVQAQEARATAEQDYISAMYSYQLARAGLARATGAAEQSIRQ